MTFSICFLEVVDLMEVKFLLMDKGLTEEEIINNNNTGRIILIILVHIYH
jgi:hypothetical protein